MTSKTVSVGLFLFASMLASSTTPAESPWKVNGVTGTTPDLYEVTTQGKSAAKLRSTGDQAGFATAWMERELSFEGELPRVARVTADANAKVSRTAVGLWISATGPGDQLTGPIVDLRPVTEGGTWESRTLQLVIESGANVSFGVGLAGLGEVEFREVECSVENPADRPPASEAATLWLDSVLDRMERRSIRRQSLNWNSIRERAAHLARGAVAPSDAHVAARDALARLNDGHSALLAASTRNNGVAMPLSGQPSSRRLPSGVWVLELPGHAHSTSEANEAYTRAVREALDQVSERSGAGLILDLRRNGGGTMWPMLLGLAPLLSEVDQHIGAFHESGRADAKWWVRSDATGFGETESMRLTNTPELFWDDLSKMPVAVVTSRQTASSGEAIAVAFRKRPHSKAFGRATAGRSTVNESHELSDGSLLLLTVGVYVDREGEKYGGPIQPDAEAEDAIEAAENWLLTP